METTFVTTVGAAFGSNRMDGEGAKSSLVRYAMMRLADKVRRRAGRDSLLLPYLLHHGRRRRVIRYSETCEMPWLPIRPTTF